MWWTILTKWYIILTYRVVFYINTIKTTVSFSGEKMNMDNEYKLIKMKNDFSLLSEEQQDYILGILQALVFAKNTSGQPYSEIQENKLNTDVKE